MSSEPDLIVVTILVGPGMNGRPATQDLGGFQRIVSQTPSSGSNHGIGLNLIFDQDESARTDSFEGVEVVRFDKRRQRATVVVTVPRDLPAAETTQFIRMQTAESLRKLEAYLLKKHVSGSIETVRNVLQRASAALPSNPLSDSERYREVVPSHQLPDTPVRTVAELDAGGLEIRKIDTYADGAMDYAVRSIETGTTRLNGRLPGSADVVRLISAAEFLKLWQQAIDQAQPRGLITVVENPNATDQDHGH